MTIQHRIELRSLAPDDRDEVARLWFDSWRATGLSDGSTPARLARRLRDESWHTVVAASSFGIIGFLAYEPEHRWLRQLFVKPAWQRSGLGTTLLGVAKEAMPEGFWLRTQLANVAAIAFYERSGLRLGSQERHPKTGEPVLRYVWAGKSHPS